MALYDLVKFTTATAGTGTVTSSGAATGYRTMLAAGIPDGTEVEYAIHDGTAKETGTGIVGGTSTTLTRVLSTSTTGSLLVLSGSAEVLITPIAARLISRDSGGAIRSATNAGANVVTVPLTNYLYQAANYTLTNSNAEQKLFDETPNGRLTLPTGFYYFECWLVVTSMSATSGSAAFDPIGAGTAVADRFAYDTFGLDNNTQPNAVLAVSGVGSVTQQTGANVVVAGTGTGMRVRIQGVFRITTAGTIIPSISLVTAAAAVVNAGSNFIIQKLGETTEATVGAWD